MLCLILGIGRFGLRLAPSNCPAPVLILILAIIVFSGIGILSASFVVVFKRTRPITWPLGSLSYLSLAD